MNLDKSRFEFIIVAIFKKFCLFLAWVFVSSVRRRREDRLFLKREYNVVCFSQFLF